MLINTHTHTHTHTHTQTSREWKEYHILWQREEKEGEKQLIMKRAGTQSTCESMDPWQSPEIILLTDGLFCI